MKKLNTSYKQYTIGELIRDLKDIIENNSYINYGSPIMISDFNMSSQKYEFSILPAFAHSMGTAGVCLFHSLNEPVEEPVINKGNTSTEKIIKQNSLLKFAKRMKN